MNALRRLAGSNHPHCSPERESSCSSEAQWGCAGHSRAKGPNEMMSRSPWGSLMAAVVCPRTGTDALRSADRAEDVCGYCGKHAGSGHHPGSERELQG